METLNITSGKLFISDPCYNVNPEKNELLTICKQAKNGKWNVYTDGRKGAIAKYSKFLYIDTDTITLTTCSVDSGQISFFDYGFYTENYDEKDDECTNWYNEESIYRKICNNSENQDISSFGNSVTVTNFGGDGDYDVELYFDKNNECILVHIHFYEDDEWYLDRDY